MNERHKKIIDALYKSLSDFSYKYDRYSDTLNFEIRTTKGHFNHTITQDDDISIFVKLIELY